MATFETSKQAVLDRINTLASSSSTTAEDSIYLAKALREAAADIAFVWRGPWTSTYTYVLGDVVQHDGNAYICINAHVAAATFDSASGSWQTMVVGGAQWFTGNTVPANSSGEDGDWFFNTADEKIHNRQSGTWVSIADLGGSIWTSSVGVGTGGEDGDFHFNETTQEISKRSSGTWTVLADLTPLNMSNVEVKTAYEANANTNEFSDAEQTKLAGIEAGSNLIINNNQIANGAGYITVGLPTGGSVGDIVTNTAAGTGNWQTPAAGGKLLQAHTQMANITGDIGHGSDVHLTPCDITITTLGSNSKFQVMGHVNATDTDSNTFGMGIGFYIDHNSGPSGHSGPRWLRHPQPHEMYLSAGNDKYWFLSYSGIFEADFPAGSNITFRLYTKFNNGNGRWDDATAASPYDDAHLSIMEIGQ
jgi:hypothetical protein